MSQTFAMKAFFAVCVAVCLTFCGNVCAEQQPASLRPALVPSSQGIFLVFPFENDGTGPRLDWLGKGLEELTIQRLSAAGQHLYTHEARTTELDRDGFRPPARFRHPPMLRIASDLNADFAVFRTSHF